MHPLFPCPNGSALRRMPWRSERFPPSRVPPPPPSDPDGATPPTSASPPKELLPTPPVNDAPTSDNSAVLLPFAPLPHTTASANNTLIRDTHPSPVPGSAVLEQTPDLPPAAGSMLTLAEPPHNALAAAPAPSLPNSL